jgi:hypothetical protein
MKLPKWYTNHLRYQRDDLERLTKTAERHNALLEAGLDLSESASTDISSYSTILYVDNRDDLQEAMKLALPGKTWTKKTEGPYMVYSLDEENSVVGQMVFIYARDAALPPTCEEVEEEIVQAAQPARTYKRKVIKCNVPVKGENAGMDIPVV